MENELKHYGVLGMKWGVHRAKTHSSKAAKNRKASEKAIERSSRYASEGKKGRAVVTKAYGMSRNGAAAVRQARSNKISSKHERRMGSDAYDRLNRQTLGKTVVQSMLMGTYGAMKYSQARAKGRGRATSFISSFLFDKFNIFTGGLVGVLEPRLNSESKKHYKERKARQD